MLNNLEPGDLIDDITVICNLADLPENRYPMTAIYADDIVVLASHLNPVTVSKIPASEILQSHLGQLQGWLK